jgi:hypothetical protein
MPLWFGLSITSLENQFVLDGFRSVHYDSKIMLYSKKDTSKYKIHNVITGLVINKGICFVNLALSTIASFLQNCPFLV